MKQRITVEQLEELTDEQKKKLKEFDFTESAELPRLTIGEMIEILETQNEFQITKWNDWMVYCNKTSEIRKSELCDALWEAVKEIL